MTQSSVKKICIFGGGLAGKLCALALAKALPKTLELVFIETPHADQSDLFYGTVTAPDTYDFLLKLGITEPDLLLNTETAFSLGTHFVNWGADSRSWTQSFYRPLPVYNGVDLHHYILRENRGTSQSQLLEPYIMSVQAAKKGAFAHPPEAQKTPLSALQYGYHYLPQQWAQLLSEALDKSQVISTVGEIEHVVQTSGHVTTLVLKDGTHIDADFFIDCREHIPDTLKTIPSEWLGARKLKSLSAHRPRPPSSETSPNHTSQTLTGRILTGKTFGWSAETPLQDSIHSLSIFDPSNEAEARKSFAAENSLSADAPSTDVPCHDFTVGYDPAPWTGNLLKLGPRAAMLEPLSPAPLMMLQADIDRLIELIPVSATMTVERREYNRRFAENYDHASMFHQALFISKKNASNPYWTTASSVPLSEKLNTKLTQFESRGLCVQYDYEPFSPQDWTMAHFGMGRVPRRYDPLADRAPHAQIEKTLQQIRNSITQVADKMPLHDSYMARLKTYLRKKNG